VQALIPASTYPKEFENDIDKDANPHVSIQLIVSYIGKDVMRLQMYSFNSVNCTLDIHMSYRALPHVSYTSLGLDKFLQETYKALGLRGDPPTFKMRPFTGPLQTGTYVSELVETPGKYTTVNSDRSKFTFTNDPRSDAAKVRMFKDL